MPAGRDRTQPITAELLDEAKEALILRRETHLDQLADKLREPRVRRVIEPMLAGETAPESLPRRTISSTSSIWGWWTASTANWPSPTPSTGRSFPGN